MQSITSEIAARHPRPLIDRLAQAAALALAGVLTLAAVTLTGIALSAGLPLLLAAALLTLGLVPVALLPTTIAPAVTVTDEAMLIAPLIWRRRSVAWRDIRALKPNPLLPPANAESGRRLVVGRRRYEPARGVIVIIPSLPVQYRIAGFFAGEGFTGVIALGSRTHEDYDRLLAAIGAHHGS